MTYEAFKEEFMSRLAERAERSEQIGTYQLFEDGASSEELKEKNFIRETNIKYNKIESDVLKGDFLSILHKQCEESLARYEMKYLFQSYEAKGWDFVWEIIEKNLETVTHFDMQSLLQNVHQYDRIQDRLILRAINYTDNRYTLKNCVYRQIGDIALVLYLFVAQTEEYGLTTTKVPKAAFEEWGKDMEEVLENALVNTNIRSVPRMYTAPKESYKTSYQTGAYMALDAKCQLGKYGLGRCTFTTYPQLNGAISFWYPGVQEKIAEMAGGDYYVAFTGIHEFHVHPVNTVPARQILGRLKDMNKYMNKEDEILSRKVYLYRADTKELTALEL